VELIEELEKLKLENDSLRRQWKFSDVTATGAKREQLVNEMESIADTADTKRLAALLTQIHATKWEEGITIGNFLEEIMKLLRPLMDLESLVLITRRWGSDRPLGPNGDGEGTSLSMEMKNLLKGLNKAVQWNAEQIGVMCNGIDKERAMFDDFIKLQRDIREMIYSLGILGRQYNKLAPYVFGFIVTAGGATQPMEQIAAHSLYHQKHIDELRRFAVGDDEKYKVYKEAFSAPPSKDLDLRLDVSVSSNSPPLAQGISISSPEGDPFPTAAATQPSTENANPQKIASALKQRKKSQPLSDNASNGGSDKEYNLMERVLTSLKSPVAMNLLSNIQPLINSVPPIDGSFNDVATKALTEDRRPHVRALRKARQDPSSSATNISPATSTSSSTGMLLTPNTVAVPSALPFHPPHNTISAPLLLPTATPLTSYTSWTPSPAPLQQPICIPSPMVTLPNLTFGISPSMLSTPTAMNGMLTETPPPPSVFFPNNSFMMPVPTAATNTLPLPQYVPTVDSLAGPSFIPPADPAQQQVQSLDINTLQALVNNAVQAQMSRLLGVLSTPQQLPTAQAGHIVGSGMGVGEELDTFLEELQKMGYNPLSDPKEDMNFAA